MSLALHDLLVCCRGLENDKATERKVIAHTWEKFIKLCFQQLVLLVNQHSEYYFNLTHFSHLQKEADRFRRLLRAPEVVQELDRSSGPNSKSSKQLTWDAVFRFLFMINIYFSVQIWFTSKCSATTLCTKSVLVRMKMMIFFSLDFCSVMCRRRQKACSLAKRSQQRRWPHARRRCPKCAV